MLRLGSKFLQLICDSFLYLGGCEISHCAISKFLCCHLRSILGKLDIAFIACTVIYLFDFNNRLVCLLLHLYLHLVECIVAVLGSCRWRNIITCLVSCEDISLACLILPDIDISKLAALCKIVLD